MKHRKGFTLVELLAVIVILGVLLLIAVPAVQNIIENSKRGAAKDEAIEALNAVYNCSLPGSSVCDAATASTYLQNGGTLSYTPVENTSVTDPTFTVFSYTKGDYQIYATSMTLTGLKNALASANFNTGKYLICSGTSCTASDTAPTQNNNNNNNNGGEQNNNG